MTRPTSTDLKELKVAIWWQYKIIRWLLNRCQNEPKELLDLIRQESNRLIQVHCAEELKK